MLRRCDLVLPVAVAWALFACGGEKHNTTIDAAAVDAAVTLSCDSYCTAIQANCTGDNAQYVGTDALLARTSCLNTCALFEIGTLSDTQSNTLGCRLHYAIQASDPAVAAIDCPRAGPAGDVVSSAPGFCSGGDACASFCALEIQACGSVQMPLPGEPRDARGNPLDQYVNMTNCVSSCSQLDKAHAYGPSAMGNSFACRLYQATQAVIDVMPHGVMSCADTGLPPSGRCVGTATP